MPMEELLDESLRFFATFRTASGLYLDKSFIGSVEQPDMCSLSATGFGLVTLCIGTERGLHSIVEALRLAAASLNAVSRVRASTNGFMLHWCSQDGSGDGEFSTIDTALFLAKSIN